ncbi:hypothetical protein CAPTEDRAFT_187422 [Capitella teleta]|uniref:Proline-rich transmembrane protein 3/4 domain-containing protein n=1 Tax=Capitella teleta TaxID=283909 RepID=R7TGN0_CAPTE|nr:hypothetical protein CAPTEDRAFT_187422 [Capitella teleta]|eukprot:ELT90736.1 hypothetical protein CAPTEDRAFT_187422 [Capitella teleta]
MTDFPFKQILSEARKIKPLLVFEHVICSQWLLNTLGTTFHLNYLAILCTREFFEVNHLVTQRHTQVSLDECENCLFRQGHPGRRMLVVQPCICNCCHKSCERLGTNMMELVKLLVLLCSVGVSAKHVQYAGYGTPQKDELIGKDSGINPLCKALRICRVLVNREDVDFPNNRINPLQSIVGRIDRPTGMKLEPRRDQWKGESHESSEDKSSLGPVRTNDELAKHHPGDKLGFPPDQHSGIRGIGRENKSSLENGRRRSVGREGNYLRHTDRFRRGVAEVSDEEPANETVSGEEEGLNDTQLSYRFLGVFSLVDESFSSDKHPGGIVGSENVPDPASSTEAPNNESPSTVSISTNAIRTTKDSNHSVLISGEESTVSSLISEKERDNEGLPESPESYVPLPEAEPELPELPDPLREKDLNISDTSVEYEVDINVDYGSEPELSHPEPEVPVSKPEMEYSGFSDPETEPEPEDEPTAEPEIGDDGCIRECYAEPAPEWDEAKDVWKTAWEIHVYGFGIAFVVVAVYALASIIRLSQYRNLLSQGYFISLNVMLLVLCSSRAVLLLVDGYNSERTFHPIVAYLIYSLGFPSLTSAFSILFLALLRTLKMQVISAKIQSPRTLILIISLHFSISILTDMIIGYYFDSRITSMVCQIASLIWGFFLMASYFYTFRRLYASAVRQHSDLSRFTVPCVKDSYDGPSVRKTKPRIVMNLALKITLITALLGFLNMGVHIYGMIDVINVFKQETPEPWPWWAMHFTLRLTELAMAVLMMFVASQPLRYPHNVRDKDPSRNKQWWDMLYFIPCFRICQIENQDDSRQELQMTAHQESLLRSQSSYCHAQINHNITLTPNLDIQTRVIDNRLFAAVADTETRGCASSRPTSMLVQEDGLIRFRLEDDPVGEPITSTDDELDADPGNTNENCRSENEEFEQTVNRYLRCHSVPAKDSKQGVPATHSLPNTGTNTPATPRSFLSIDPEEGVFTFRPPSSIHLRASIEGALDYSDLSLKSPGFSDVEGFSLTEEFEDADEFQSWTEKGQMNRVSSPCDIPSVAYHGTESKGSAYSPLSEDDERYTQAEVREFLMKSSIYGSEYLSHIQSEYHDYGTHV